MLFTPEEYVVEPNRHAPNSPLPILIYRNVLPRPLSEDATTRLLEGNDWEKRGTWGHIPVRHFHPNSHECYGIFQGSSTLLLGRGANDEAGGLKVHVSAGDVIVLPAGTAHCCMQSSEDYRYIGVYPKGCPRWRNEFGYDSTLVAGLREEAKKVTMPTQDPVNGRSGPLVQLWKDKFTARL